MFLKVRSQKLRSCCLRRLQTLRRSLPDLSIFLEIPCGTVRALRMCMATQSRPPIVEDPRTYEIIGAAMEVHRQLGCGFVEPVYQAALTNEFLRREIPFAREVAMRVDYKGDRLEVKYCADFVVTTKSSSN